MTNPKADHKNKTHISADRSTSHSDLAGTAPEGQTNASSTMIEACDRLAQKLDEVGGIMINDAPKGLERTSFIRMDPPEHDDQRREVSSTVNPITLAKMDSAAR